MKTIITFLLFTQVAFSQNWTQVTNFPSTERDDGVGVTVNSNAYFGTGLRASGGNGADFYVFNGSTWSAIAPMPGGQQRQYACAFSGNNCFYVFGGDGVNGILKDLYKYIIATDTWTTAASKPGIGVYGASSLQFGNKVIIIGGKSSATNLATNEVWEYTISTDTWLQKNNFPFGGRFRASADVYNTTGYLLFGIDDQDHVRKEMYSYNPTNDTWTKILDFPQPLGRAYATLKAVNGKLLLFGGYDSSNSFYKDIWYFDPVSEVWTKHFDFPSFARKGGMSVILANKFYYTCGVTATERIKETWVLDVPVGLKETPKPLVFSVYPNPVTSVLYLQTQSQTQINKAVLFDVSGKELMTTTTFTLKDNTIQLDLSTIDKGIYFLRIEGEHSLEWKKLVKE